MSSLKQDWFANIRSDLLAGLVVALALIPEAIAFSIIAGVDPKVGLYASFCIAVVTAFMGGRPGMISAATAAMALLMIGLVKEHGLQYLLAATILTGVLLSGVFFAQKVGQILLVRSAAENEGRIRRYQITGQVFFASADRFVDQFDFREVIDTVVVDVSKAHFWDITAISALDKVVMKFRREGTNVEVVGLNEASATLVDKFALHDKDDVEWSVGH